MWLPAVRATTKALALATLGFTLGLLGISAYEGRSPTGVFLSQANSGRGTLASASCVPEEQAESDEIFFLSCGGIF